MAMTEDTRDRDCPDARLLRFAQERLGPASRQLLADPANQVLALGRIRDGFDLADAVLAVVHGAASRDRPVADEFLAFFLGDLMRMGKRLRSTSLRRFLDSGDLVQSMVGDLWPDLASVRFETRGQFLAYLGRRLTWKASDRARGLESGRRREDRRVEGDPAGMQLPTRSPSPASVVAREEERQRLALRLLRLPGRDREILTLHLRGASLDEMARELEVTYDAARMALQRAMGKAKRLR